MRLRNRAKSKQNESDHLFPEFDWVYEHALELEFLLEFVQLHIQLKPKLSKFLCMYEYISVE